MKEINVYYVAFTRAELGLIVVAKDKKESKKESKNKTMREKLDLVPLEEGRNRAGYFSTKRAFNYKHSHQAPCLWRASPRDRRRA